VSFHNKQRKCQQYLVQC